MGKKAVSMITVAIDYLSLDRLKGGKEEFSNETRIHAVNTDCEKGPHYCEEAIGKIVERTHAADQIKCPGCDYECFLTQTRDSAEYLKIGKHRDFRILRRITTYAGRSVHNENNTD